MNAKRFLLPFAAALVCWLGNCVQAAYPEAFFAKFAAAYQLPLETSIEDQIAAWKQAVTASDQLGPRYAWLSVEAHGRLGVVLRQAGQSEAALKAFENALAMLGQLGTNSLPPVSPAPMVLTALAFHLGELYDWAGRTEAASAMYRQLLQLPDLKREYRAGALVRLGNVLLQLDDLAGAEKTFKESLAIYQELPEAGPQSLHSASLLNSLAQIHLRQLQFELAKGRLSKALGIAEGMMGDNAKAVATVARLGLARILSLEGKWDEARNHVQANIEAWRDYTDRTVYAVQLLEGAQTLVALGPLAQSAARAEQCRPMVEEALEIVSQAVSRSHPLRVGADLIEARILVAANDIEAQGRLRSIMTRTRNEPSLYTYHALAEQELLMFHSMRGEILEMVDVADSFFRESLRRLRQMLVRLTAKDHLALIESAHASLQLVLGVARSVEGKLPQRALEWALNLKACAGEVESLRVRMWNQSAAPEVIAARIRWTQALRSLATAELNESQFPAHQMAAMRLEAQDSEQALTQLLAGDVALPDWRDVSQIQAGLRPEQVLVEFYRYRAFNLAGKEFGPEHYVAWIVKHEGEPSTLPLGPAAETDARLKRIREEMNAFEGNYARGSANAEQEFGRGLEIALDDLSQKSLSPIWSALDQATELVIAADGPLASVPWDAIPLPDGMRILDRFPITFVKTGRDVLKRTATAASSNSAVFVAAPDFNAGLSAADISWRKDLMETLQGKSLNRGDALHVYWTPLGLSDASTTTIADSLKQASGKCDVLAGPDASERRIKVLAGPEILVINTHGYSFSSEDAGASLVGPTEDKPRTLSFGITDALPAALVSATQPAQESRPVQHLLLDCGLALAAANQRGPLAKGAEDGLLTGQEIVSLNLAGTRLVVLGACETGIGGEISGEGTLSLSHAFSLAGAESVIATLWKVPETETTFLLSELLKSLSALGRHWKSEDVAVALRRAKQQIRNERSGEGQVTHPYFYAGFQLSR